MIFLTLRQCLLLFDFTDKPEYNGKMLFNRRKTFFGMLAAVVISAGVLSLPVSAQDTAEKRFVDLSAGEAYSMIRENSDNEDFIIIDVRTPGEFGAGHIENAVDLDFYSQDFRDNLEKLDKSAVYLVYCRSGNRSAKAVNLMERLGFVSVYNIKGGIISWASRNLPLVR